MRDEQADARSTAIEAELEEIARIRDEQEGAERQARLPRGYEAARNVTPLPPETPRKAPGHVPMVLDVGTSDHDRGWHPLERSEGW